jgi:aminoglycoside 2'-N-acetyltransferase I
MPTLHSASNADLSVSFQNDLRQMLDAAFERDFSDDDWRHFTGGIHVWLLDGDTLISHGSLVPRTLESSGHRVLAGYVEGIATAEAYRRKGYGSQIMNRLNTLIRESYQLGALSTGTCAFYETVGWERWRGRTFVDGPDGRQATPNDDDSIMILRTSSSPSLALDGDIVCNWRAGDVW